MKKLIAILAFGLSALEAALSGCALVLGDIPSLREVWGDAALFVAPDDTDALAQALQGLIDRPAYRRELADRATKRAGLYTPRRMARLPSYDAQRASVHLYTHSAADALSGRVDKPAQD